MVRFTVSIPTVRANQIVSNVVGLAGLLGVVVAVGGLADNWWWSLLAGSLAAIGVSWVAHTHARTEDGAGP